MPLLSAEERLGTKLSNKYRLDRILGEGGMGVVFEANDLRFDRKVAVKFLHAQYAREPEVVRRFTNEAKAAAKLHGDHVVAVHDVDTDPADGSPYIVLEFLEGEPLTKRLGRGRLPASEAWKLFDPLMEVLELAHQRRIVHRDLKPDNIFLAYNWKGVLVPKLLDFGVAKLMEGTSAGHTSSGTLVGTPMYMSPEQALGRDVGPWCDVWSMGVIWFEALTGRMHHDFEFEGSALTSIVLAIVNDSPKRVLDVAPDVDPAVAAVVDRALAMKRADRFSSMEDFRTAMMLAVEVEEISMPRESSHEGSTVPDARSPLGHAATLLGAGAPLPPAAMPQAGPSSHPIGTVPGLSKVPPLRYALIALGVAAIAGAVLWTFAGPDDATSAESPSELAAQPPRQVEPPPLAVVASPPTTPVSHELPTGVDLPSPAAPPASPTTGRADRVRITVREASTPRRSTSRFDQFADETTTEVDVPTPSVPPVDAVTAPPARAEAPTESGIHLVPEDL